MDLADVITIVAGIGGIQGVIEAVKWWRGRKVQDRQDVANVEAVEDDNIRKQIDWLEKRLMERDTKIDGIYSELRATQKLHMDELHAHHETQLLLKDAECKKCHKRGCPDRVPPSEY